jgi:hypothetical protein
MTGTPSLADPAEDRPLGGHVAQVHDAVCRHLVFLPLAGRIAAGRIVA